MIPAEFKSHKWFLNHDEASRAVFMDVPKRFRPLSTSDHGFPEPRDILLSNAKGRKMEDKTKVALSIAGHWVRRKGVVARYITASQYVQMGYDSMNEPGGHLPEDQYQSPYLKHYIERMFDVLVLSGLGNERFKVGGEGAEDWASYTLGSLISERWELGLATLVVSPLNMMDIKRRYGGLNDRLFMLDDWATC